MPEIQKVYHVRKEKKIGLVGKINLRLKQNKSKRKKARISSANEKEKLQEMKRIAQEAQRQALKEEKALLKEEQTKAREEKRIAKQLEKQRKARDKKILQEAEAHEKELNKAYKKELKEENLRLKKLEKEQRERLKRNETIRESNRARFKEEHKVKNNLSWNQRNENTSYNSLTRAEKRRIDKTKHEEFMRKERIKEAERKADEAIERERKKRAGLTPWILLREKFKRLLKVYSFRNLQETINTYGYSYSFQEFIITALLVVIGVSAVAWISQLRNIYLYTIIIVATLSIPFLIYSYFRQLYNTQRFEMVQSYLSNILPIFMQKPKYRYAVDEIRDLSADHMKKTITKAIDYIDTNTDDPDVVKTSMDFIETEYPNSRVKAVHKLMRDIENGNSENYSDICENMFVDVEGWIRRVYNFQKELKGRRTSLLMLCALSVVLNTIFTYMYGTSEVFDGFTDKKMYQICTFIFVLATFFVASLILTKLHGSWLVDDALDKHEEEKIRNYNYIQTHDGSAKPSDIVIAFMGIFAGVVMLLFMDNKIGLAVMAFGAFFAVREKMVLKSKTDSIGKSLMIEFPNWLRGVVLDLNDMTVVSSIEKSMKNCSYMMKKELERFFEMYNEDPTSIRPFSSFLEAYKLEDVQSSMKILYTLQSMSKEEINKQVSSIIQRNQELLAKTEQLQNQESLGTAEMLGYAPMMLLTGQLIMSMVLMFIHIMEYMDTITSTIG